MRNDPTGIFTLRPSVGLVPRGATQLVAVRFAPAEVQRYSRTVSIVLNTSAARPLLFTMHGSGTKVLTYVRTYVRMRTYVCTYLS